MAKLVQGAASQRATHAAAFEPGIDLGVREHHGAGAHLVRHEAGQTVVDQYFEAAVRWIVLDQSIHRPILSGLASGARLFIVVDGVWPGPRTLTG